MASIVARDRWHETVAFFGRTQRLLLQTPRRESWIIRGFASFEEFTGCAVTSGWGAIGHTCSQPSLSRSIFRPGTSDKYRMPATSPTRLLFTLARAAGKAAMSNLRGAGWTPEYQDWPARASVCERCPLQVVKVRQELLRSTAAPPRRPRSGRRWLWLPDGGQGQRPDRTLPHHRPARTVALHSAGRIGCDCKWCDATRRPQILPAAA